MDHRESVGEYVLFFACVEHYFGSLGTFRASTCVVKGLGVLTAGATACTVKWCTCVHVHRKGG